MNIPEPKGEYLCWLVRNRIRRWMPLPVAWMYRELYYRRMRRDWNNECPPWPGENWLRKFIKDCVDCRRKYPEHPASMMIELEMLSCWPQKKRTPEEQRRVDAQVQAMLDGKDPFKNNPDLQK